MHTAEKFVLDNRAGCLVAGITWHQTCLFCVVFMHSFAADYEFMLFPPMALIGCRAIVLWQLALIACHFFEASIL
jgi:hypothetical protein